MDHNGTDLAALGIRRPHADGRNRIVRHLAIEVSDVIYASEARL